jgi:hypothetical protein
MAATIRRTIVAAVELLAQRGRLPWPWAIRLLRALGADA